MGLSPRPYRSHTNERKQHIEYLFYREATQEGDSEAIHSMVQGCAQNARIARATCCGDSR